MEMTIKEAHEILSNGLLNAPSEHAWCVAFNMAIDTMRKIDNAPTVEAIPKADYENRLKADKIAMLTELQDEIEKMPTIDICIYAIDNCVDRFKIENLIQDRIDKLKETNNVDTDAEQTEDR